MTAAVATRRGPLPQGGAWEALIAENRPVLFRGAADDLALVKAGLHDPAKAAALLQDAWSGEPVVVFRAPPEVAGRFFYTPQLDGLNFSATREPLGAVLQELTEASDRAAPDSVYVGSSDLARFFPGLAEHSTLDLAAIHPMLVEHPGLASLWLGNRTIASCHYDYSHNIAVCAVGRRRFTLFPPDQAANLYPGPLEPTPGGQVVSMVDIADPDLNTFPRFARALELAQVAEMEAGDVLVYPALWWHQVEALAPFNVLINYWWNAVPGYVDSPQTTLLHAMLSLRERPLAERAAWRALFDYYVFDGGDAPRRHLPEAAQGPLAPLDAQSARRLRAMIQQRLQR